MMMNYCLELYDAQGRRVAVFDELPLLEVTRSAPDEADLIRGLLPVGLESLGAGYGARVHVNGALFCEGGIERVAPQWGEGRKLIFDEYVPHRAALAFEARGARARGNTPISAGYVNKKVGAIVKDVLNRAPGPIHYTVAHGAYPDGAVAEYGKFAARKTPENELDVGGGRAGGFQRRLRQGRKRDCGAEGGWRGLAGCAFDDDQRGGNRA